MQGIFSKAISAAAAILCLPGTFAVAQEGSSDTAVIISVAEQKLVVLRDGGWIKKFPISTSKFGLGDSYGSYKTPLGRMKVCQKIGNDLTPGAVLKLRHATGEVLPVNAPGRDPIVTRIIWLEGLEPQNANARERGIYIHGTVEENKIGEPVSYGCIRMRSKDVVDVFEEIPLDTPVTIIAEKLPRFPKYTAPKAPIIAAAAPAAKPTPSAPAPTPPPVISLQTRPNLERSSNLEPSTRAEAPANPGATLALKGSILDAGLPEGPKMPPLPSPPEPKDVPRFGALDPGLPSESPFSLRGISRDLAPAKRVAGTDATAREIVSSAEKEDPPKESSKPASKIAFRANGTVVKKP